MVDVMHTPDEHERLEALRRYAILDTPPDGAFDRITALAASLFKVPIALVSLVDEDRIWFKSKHGLSVDQIERAPGLCASAVYSPGAYVVRDAVRDPRTLTNPLVVGALGLRFYAAAPLVTHDGARLGTLNIIDFEPRELTASQQEQLVMLAQLVMDQMELRLAARQALSGLSEALRATPELQREALVTVCAWTKQIQVDGRWLSFEAFMEQVLGVSISHGMSPEGYASLWGGLEEPST